MKMELLLTLFLSLSLAMGSLGCTKTEATPPPSQPVVNVAPAEPIEDNDRSDPTEPDTDAPTDADHEDVIPSDTPATNTPVPSLQSDFETISTLDNTSKGWGQGNRVDELNRPVGATNYQNIYGDYAADFIGPNESVIYLTIDEGYENGFTGQILDVLNEKNCPAVFFVTLPYVKSNPDLIQRMIDEGHVIGNHSVTHPSEGLPSQSLAQQSNEITELHHYIKEHYNYDMYLFRYPAGIFSEQSLALIQQLGYRSVFWSFAYKDWVTDEQPDPSQSLTKLSEKLHPGAIYLLHAVSETNTKIMADFIDQTRSAGYQFSVLGTSETPHSETLPLLPETNEE